MPTREGEGEGEHAARRGGDGEAPSEAFEYMPSPMAAMEGPEHTIVAANAAYRALARREVVIGSPAGQVFPDVPRHQLLDLLDLVYVAGEPFTAREWLVGEDRSFDLTVSPWRGPRGGMRGVLVTQVEVTGQASRPQRAQLPAETEARARARRDMVAVQEAMLPSQLPVLPQARIAARYLPGLAEEAAGGDWFDAFPLPDSRIALVVGDVADRGVAASAAMGRLRSVLRHALTVRQDLAVVLAEADLFAAGESDLRTATLCVAVLRQADGELRYATCGHPFPLLVAADGTARFLPGTAGRPLGARHGSHAAPTLGSAGLGPGEVLLLYTDGLVERPGRTLEEGMADLAIVAGDSMSNRALATLGRETPAERVSHLTVELLTRGGYTDDVTTVALWRQPDPLTSLDIEVPARRDAVATLRHSLGEWLEQLGVARGGRQLAELAVTEVVTNAVEHAYPRGSPGPVRLEAAVRADGFLETRVTDSGRWREPDLANADRGQGLSVAAQFAEGLTIGHQAQDEEEPRGARGTVVAMRHRVHRQPMLAPLTVGPPIARAPAPSFSVDLVPMGPASLVRVSGPVDHATADRLAGALLSACRAGVIPLTVDLSAVTILASAGVSVLYRVAAQLAAHGRELTLLSGPGSPSAAVLDLAGLPRTSR